MIKNVLQILRNNYDKLLHMSLSMNIIYTMDNFISCIFIQLITVLLLGIAWQIINHKLFGTKISMLDMLFNMFGAILAVIISY